MFDPVSVAVGMGIGVGVCLVMKILSWICC